MEFLCKLGRSSGEIIEGVYAAEDEAHLRREFDEKGFFVLSLRRRAKLRFPSGFRLWRRRFGQRDFIVFNQELATLLKAGLPVVESLDILRERTENRAFKSVLDDVCQRVRAGEALSQAFEVQTPKFSGVYVASLMAGEKSGSLEGVIRRYIAHARILNAVRRKAVSALIYPLILFGLSLLVVGIIVLRVVPEFAEFYGGLGAELPLITRGIMVVSEGLRGHFLLILVTLLTAVVTLGLWIRRPGRGAMFERILLSLPGIGAIMRKFATSQLARTLATLLGGGVPLVSALDIAGRSIGNRYFTGQLEVIAGEVREGLSLSEAMARRNIFPAVAIKMVEVGESTGSLQEMLSGVADFFDEEIETVLGRVMTLLEPVLLVVMGLVIASILIALYMPLLQLGSLV